MPGGWARAPRGPSRPHSRQRHSRPGPVPSALGQKRVKSDHAASLSGTELQGRHSSVPDLRPGAGTRSPAVRATAMPQQNTCGGAGLPPPGVWEAGGAPVPAPPPPHVWGTGDAEGSSPQPEADPDEPPMLLPAASPEPLQLFNEGRPCSALCPQLDPLPTLPCRQISFTAPPDGVSGLPLPRVQGNEPELPCPW